MTVPKEFESALISRIKVIADLDITESRKPQDGRIVTEIDNRPVDLRISTLPIIHGEKVVIRILDKSALEFKLSKLGFSEHNAQVFQESLDRPNGIILVTGPTGSGKSTTLYSILNEVDRDKQNVLSLEDPVEYTIPGVSQSQVRPEIGYTFATGLRTTLRQDPNIIMVGEIRDAETANLAVQAALTGHLVLSTIHTNNAVGIIPRLLDMGVEPYLIPPVLILGMAQRLVKTLCKGGGKKVPVEGSMEVMMQDEFKDLPAEFQKDIPPLKEVYLKNPTPECPAGTRGRIAVYEMFDMNVELERAILANKPEDEIFGIARKNGMLTMKEDAIIKAASGVIPFEEVNTLGGQFELPDELPEIDAAAKPVALDEESADTDDKDVAITPGPKKEVEL